MEKTLKIERQSNFELLRIISMLMIIAHHFSCHGGFDFSLPSPIYNVFWIDSLLPIGKIGVDIFILISGYFLSKSSKLTIKKIAKFWGQVFFYSVSIYFFGVLIQKEKWSLSILGASFFPLIKNDWWFASAYFIMLMISPMLNFFIDSISCRQHRIILIGGFIFWSFIPIFLSYNCGFNYVLYVLWFFYLFFVSAYIRKYKDNVKISSIKCLMLSIVLWLASFMTELVLPSRFVILPKLLSQDVNTLFVFLSSVLIFIAFKNINIGKSRVINTIASATFGVYLIHDSDLIRNVLWHDIFRNSSYQNSNFLVLYTIFAVIVVFVVASVIDFIRINTIEKLFMKLVDKVEPKLKKAANSLLEIIVKAAKCCETVLKKRALNNIDK